MTLFSSRIFAGREAFSSKPTQECFEDMLSWLWINVVDPVYQVLQSVSEHLFFIGPD
jgi:hypothetical protein